MSKTTRLVLILILLSFCALTVLCGGGAYFAYRTLTPSTTGGVRPQPTSAAERTSSQGGSLVIYGGLPPTLDPALVQDSTSAEYVVHLFSGLVSLDGELNLVPDLAERWAVSPDGLTYTFTLRENASFADGRALTAEDVRYSLERACSPQLHSPVALSYLGDIVGAEDYFMGKADHIAGLATPDAHTVTLQMDAPKAYFLAKLTYPTAFVVDRDQIAREGEDWVRHPNGSGPFVLESLSRERIVLVRNERYYRAKPALARVTFIIRGGDPVTMYENDELDMAAVGPDEIERVLDPENPLHSEAHLAPELSTEYIAMNVTQPPFDDPLVRQAFAQAIDTAKIAQLVLKNTAMPARGILPPGLAHGAKAAALPYDPARAKQLLAQSRYGGTNALPPISLAISGTSGHMPPVVRAVTSMLEETLGVVITVEQVDWADFLQDMNKRRYQMFMAGWIADYPDPQNFLDLLFHSSSAQNHTGYVNSEVDALLEKARLERDASTRMALYLQAEKKILADAPWVPLTHGVTVMLVKPYVQGYRASASLYPWLTDISIAQ